MEEKDESAFQPKVSQRRISFYVFYPLYCMLALLCRLAAMVTSDGLTKVRADSSAVPLH